MAAFDMSNSKAVVSPGGVGFDINCGVRLLRTNLHRRDVEPLQEQLAQCLFDHIPVGVGSKGIIPMTAQWVLPILINSIPLFFCEKTMHLMLGSSQPQGESGYISDDGP